MHGQLGASRSVRGRWRSTTTEGNVGRKLDEWLSLGAVRTAAIVRLGEGNSLKG
jgi:hypothetical protein